MSAEFEILAVLNRYLHGIDVRDIDQIAECFTANAKAVYDDNVDAGNSREEIVAFIEKAGAVSGAVWGASMHSLANWAIELTSETTARSSITVEAVLLDKPRGSNRAVRRGLRYEDDLVKTPAGWKIQARRHRLLWTYAVEDVGLS